jgi:L-lactate permease
MSSSAAQSAPAIPGIAPSRVTMTVSAFAWNKDSSKIAVCPNNNEIWIYRVNGKHTDATKWERIQVLKEVVSYIFEISIALEYRQLT